MSTISVAQPEIYQRVRNALYQAGLLGDDSLEDPHIHYDFLMEKNAFDGITDNMYHVFGRAKKYVSAYIDAEKVTKDQDKRMALAYAHIDQKDTRDDLDNLPDYTPEEGDQGDPARDSEPPEQPKTSRQPAGERNPKKADETQKDSEVEATQAAGSLNALLGLPITLAFQCQSKSNRDYTLTVTIPDGDLQRVKEVVEAVSIHIPVAGWVQEQATRQNGTHQTGEAGNAAIDFIVYAPKTIEGKTYMYVELWQDGRKYATCATRNEDEIAIIARDLGVDFSKTPRLDGKFLLRYELGNLKNDKDGSKHWHYYWNIKSIARV